MRSPLMPVVATLTSLAAISHASDLSLAGAVDPTVPYGSGVPVLLSGAPSQPAVVYVDADPGPVSLNGQSVPLGLTPALGKVVSGTTNIFGDLNGFLFVPGNPSLAGATVYFAGFVVDGTGPLGADVSNGCSLTIAPPVDAGADAVVLIGDRIALDGRGVLGDDGNLAPGTTVSWTLLEAPLGSGVGLSNADTPFAVIEPDVPGVYRAQLTASVGGVSVSDTVRVDAYELQLASALDGSWTLAGSVNVAGTLIGPDLGGQLTVEGVALPVNPGGSFGPVNMALPVGQAFAPLTFELTLPDGRRARRRMTVGLGAVLPVIGGAPAGLSVHIPAGGFGEVAALGEEQLKGTDIQSLLLAQPPTLVANNEGLFGFTIFSAIVDFTGISYDPDIQLTMSPVNGGVYGTTRLTNVKGTFDVWGELLEVPYYLSGQITSSPVDLSATLDFSIQNGVVKAAVLSPSVVRNNFQFDLDGFFGSVAELFIIESWVKEQVEATVAEAIAAQLGPGVEEILNAFDVSANMFEQLGVDVTVGAKFASVQETAQGVTMTLTGTADVLSAEPGAPNVVVYPYTFSTAPTYGPLSPDGQPYEVAVSGADDFLNLVLAASTRAGMLDGDLTELLADPALGGDPAAQLLAGDLAVLFPGAGFEAFPPDAAVELAATGTLAPRVSTTPTTPSLGRIDLSGLEVEMRMPGPDASIPVLRLAIDAGAELDLGVGPDGTLLATLGTSEVGAAVLGGFPGSDLVLLQVGLDLLASFLLPTLEEALGSIPLPSLAAQGLQLTPSSIAPVGGGGDYVGFFGELEVLPTVP